MDAKVWVAYAGLEQQFHIEVAFEEGMTVADAIERSGIEHQTELPQPLSLGIFGSKIKTAEHLLESGDRVEIYRPLTINPKEIRRKRAAANPTSRYCRSNRFKQLY
ncbi:MAG: RnfH family protein [Candidatus Acinetobacter avistercoris]|uniref:RnfH family protein n=1 Tax=Acinetobacter sp. KS-LM10 TaxID=3120518 RepID=UPI001F8E40F5|nr:RnfH family protein [Candidatus Acinetobacter avistercoris]